MNQQTFIEHLLTPIPRNTVSRDSRKCTWSCETCIPLGPVSQLNEADLELSGQLLCWLWFATAEMPAPVMPAAVLPEGRGVGPGA